MATEITALTLGRMEFCEVFNHGSGKRFNGQGSIESALVERNVVLSVWVTGNTQKENVTVSVDLDQQALTALIGQLTAMKTVLVERLEAWNVA